MAYVGTVFNDNFLHYASYVIKDRAIPDVEDGLKPVQRRILHTLFEMDDGKYHKVANVVGYAMRYHPHGDASIYSALVVLANKDLLIDKQGNFGNLFTGDEASASRYIECKIDPLAKELLYNPEITTYEDSYDGRNREPVVFPAKVPIVLVHGADGIAVGMSTRILQHNFAEVLDAMVETLKGREVELYPDFPTGGLLDVSGYEDGTGRVLVRAKLDTRDPKRIVIRELPAGSTTESLIASIEQAAKRGKVKIAGINDYTSEEVEIEIKLARGVYANDVIEALYAFTDCETAISVNPLVIRDNRPVVMPVSEIVRYHAAKLVEVLKRELELEQHKLREKYHARTLERIFVEERIYKRIEEMKTERTVVNAVLKGFEPFAAEIPREVTEEDVERLLKIPIRRISLYDINKAREEMERIQARLGEIETHLGDVTSYAIDYLGGIIARIGDNFRRRTSITSFEKVDVREVAERDRSLRYDGNTGYLGHDLGSGKEQFSVSIYDRVLIVQRDGTYFVRDVPEKLFVGKGLLYCGFGDKDALSTRVFSLLYKNAKGETYLKRFRIEGFILDRKYSMLPDGAKVLDFTTDERKIVRLNYKPKPRLKKLEEYFDPSEHLIKSVKATGARLSNKDLKSGGFILKRGGSAGGASGSGNRGSAGGSGARATGGRGSAGGSGAGDSR
ncbi:MAG: DNA topoisomerase IV subunit A [Spirochaetia bacterium]